MAPKRHRPSSRGQQGPPTKDNGRAAAPHDQPINALELQQTLQKLKTLQTFQYYLGLLQMMTPPTNNNPFAQMLVAQQRAASFHQMLLQQQNHHNNTINPLRPPPPNPSNNPQALMQMYQQDRPGPLNYLQGLAGDRPPLQPSLSNPGSMLGSLAPGPASLLRPQVPSFLNLSSLLQQQQQATINNNNNASTPSSSSAPVTPVMTHTPMQMSPCTSSAPGPSAGLSTTPNMTKVYNSGKRIGRPPGSFKKHVFDLGLTQNPVISKEGRDSPGEKVDIESMEDHKCGWMDCDQIFSTRQALIEHFRCSHEPDIQQQFKAVLDESTGQPDRIWFCRWRGCERTEPFKASYMLIVHVRRHTGEKPNRCPYIDCKKAYSRLENLKTHIRTHTGEKPYHCEFPGCTKAFSNASDRAKHQNRTHSDEKPYACTVGNCNKSYTDPSSLRKHIKTVHGDDEYEKAKKNKPANPGGRRKKHQSAVTVNNPMGFLNRQQFMQQQMAMIAFQEAMRLNMGGLQQPGFPQQQQQQSQNVAQPSPSSCTPVLPLSSHGTPDGGTGSSRGGSVPANSPAGSYTSSLSSEGSASSGSGRHSRGGGLIFSVENILKFSSFYAPLVSRIGFSKYTLVGVTSLLRSMMNGRYTDLRRDGQMERTSIDRTATGRRSFPMSRHPPEPRSNHDDIPQEPGSDDVDQFHNGGGMCATLQLRSKHVKAGVLKNAQANAGVGFDTSFVSDLLEPSPADDVPFDQHLAGALEHVERQRMAGVNPENVDVPYTLTDFAERVHDGSILIDSDDESDDSFLCRSVDSAIPHCLQTSFTSGEDVDFNDFPSLNPQLTTLMPLMEPYAPRYLPDNSHSVDANHVPLQVDPTADVAEPGTLAYVTNRDPNDLPDFLQQPYKMMSQYAVQGSDSMLRGPEYLSQYRDPRMQEMLQNAQRDYFHDNYYEPSEFPGMGEDFMTRYEVNVNEQLTLPMQSLLAEPDQPGPSHR